MAKVEWNSSQWGPVFRYASASDATSHSSYPNGVHQIRLKDGRFQEILFEESPLAGERTRPIPVYLPGALKDRKGTVGPYFSGKSAAEKLGTGFISVSDPLMREDPSIKIAWYTGRPGAQAQETRLEFLSHISEISGRELLFISGSAGGFGSLQMASQLPNSRVFLWNPQTNLLKYSESSVKSYLGVALGGDWTSAENWRNTARDRLESTEIQFDLTESATPPRGIILQNDLDWHLPTHMAPYLAGRHLSEIRPGYVGTEDFGVAVLHLGSGHARPGPNLVHTMSSYMLSPDATGIGAYDLLVTSGQLDPSNRTMYPLDLTSAREDIAEQFEAKLVRVGGTLHATVSDNFVRKWPSARIEFRVASHGRRLGYMARTEVAGTYEFATSESEITVHAIVKDKLEELILDVPVLVSE